MHCFGSDHGFFGWALCGVVVVMSKLERYLEFNWPDMIEGVEGSAQDHAIHVMRELDQALGGMSAANNRNIENNIAMTRVLKMCAEWVLIDGSLEGKVRAERINAVIEEYGSKVPADGDR